MITLLIIIFIICMVVMKIKDTPEQEREHQARYLGQEFADKEYYKTLAKKQIKQEDKDELRMANNSFKLAWQQGNTRKDRIKERAEKLQREAIEEEQNNK